MDRQRHDPLFAGADPPVYKDPLAPTTPPTGTFQPIASQPPTPLLPEHMNLITEEMRNLVTALGGTPASDDDTQLATLFESGTFEPVVSGGSVGDVAGGDFSDRKGRYQRIGSNVIVWLDIAFTNTNGALDAEIMYILPPFRVDAVADTVSVYCRPNRNAATRKHRVLENLLFAAGPPIDIRWSIDEIAGDTGTEDQNIVVGNAAQVIRCQVSYAHTGEFLY